LYDLGFAHCVISIRRHCLKTSFAEDVSLPGLTFRRHFLHLIVATCCSLLPILTPNWVKCSDGRVLRFPEL